MYLDTNIAPYLLVIYGHGTYMYVNESSTTVKAFKMVYELGLIVTQMRVDQQSKDT